MTAASIALPSNGAVADLAPHAVVEATALHRRYGSGDAAVDALRGVSLEIGRGQLTAVMGPSGSGKSTLMHILAGLDRPTSGTVAIDGTEITTLGDNQLTKLRRRHIGFVFQFFNLLPMLTAEENVLLPLRLAGEKPTGRGSRRSSTPSASATAAATARPSSPAASSSASRSRGRSSRGRRCSSPTSRRATSTAARAPRCSTSSASSVDELGQTVGHGHPRRARRGAADRVLFLADGAIVKDAGRTSQSEILRALEEVA